MPKTMAITVTTDNMRVLQVFTILVDFGKFIIGSIDLRFFVKFCVSFRYQFSGMN